MNGNSNLRDRCRKCNEVMLVDLDKDNNYFYECITDNCSEYGQRTYKAPTSTSPSDFELVEKYFNADASDQQLIAETGIAWLAQLIRKNLDYGSSVFEPPIIAPHLSPLSAIDVRISDKIKRLSTLLGSQEHHIKTESIDDTFDDLGTYCLLRKIAKLKETNPQ